MGWIVNVAVLNDVIQYIMRLILLEFALERDEDFLPK